MFADVTSVSFYHSLAMASNLLVVAVLATTALLALRRVRPLAYTASTAAPTMALAALFLAGN
jgi:hypothetical protein